MCKVEAKIISAQEVECSGQFFIAGKFRDILRVEFEGTFWVHITYEDDKGELTWVSTSRDAKVRVIQ